MSQHYNNKRRQHGGDRGRGGGKRENDGTPPKPVMHKDVKAVFDANEKKHDSWSLYFDKFSGYSRKNEGILKNVIKFYNGGESKTFLKKKLEQKYSFFADLAEKDGIKLLFFENTSRLLVNMGHSCVLENVGFSFERISGLPCVPGSALKGVTSNWAIWDANGDTAFAENLKGFSANRTQLQNDLVDIFGANDGDAEQGKINFYGIFPLTLPELEIDIITPHQHGVSANPLHFMTVAAGTAWYVPIACNRGNPDAELLKKTERLIEICLTNYGVGAKTASGYGKFDIPVKSKLDALLEMLDKKQRTRQELFDKANEESAKAQKVAEAEAKALADEKKRIGDLSEDEREMEYFEKSLLGNDSESKAGDLKGRMVKIDSQNAKDQCSICLLLKGKYKYIWLKDLAEVTKVEGKVKNAKNEKAKAKAQNKLDQSRGFKRVTAVRLVAETLGIELP